MTEGPVRLPRAIADAILAHARAEAPLEACGLIPGSAPAADGGEPLRYVPCRNALASPVRYTVHPEDLLRVTVEADDAGGVIWGIVHSHVRSPAVPSPTDVDLAYYPDAAVPPGLARRRAGPPCVVDRRRLRPRGRPGPRMTEGLDRGRLAWLLAGGAALVGGTLLGWSGDLLEAIANPPALIRAALVGVSVVAALWCVAEAVRRLEAGRHVPADAMSGRDLALLVRGVRYVFLAVAALSAAAGWLIGHPLPFVVALVIAGVDILETTFLLFVIAVRRDG